MKKWYVFFFLNLIMMGLEANEGEAISAAKECLEKADVSSAALCKDLLDGYSSKESYAVRCEADFLTEGKSIPLLKKTLATRLRSSASPLLNLRDLIEIMAFDSKDSLNVVLEDCTRSENSEYLMLAQMANVATIMADTSSTGDLGKDH